MTEVASGVGTEVGTVVDGVGTGVCGVVVVRTVVGCVVAGRVAGVLVVTGDTDAVTRGVPAGIVVAPGKGVPTGDAGTVTWPLPPTGPADDVPVIWEKSGMRKYAPATRTTTAATITAQMGKPPDAGAAGAACTDAGRSGTVAPQAVQNFCDENSKGAPHFGQNLPAMIVRA